MFRVPRAIGRAGHGTHASVALRAPPSGNRAASKCVPAGHTRGASSPAQPPAAFGGGVAVGVAGGSGAFLHTLVPCVDDELQSQSSQ